MTTIIKQIHCENINWQEVGELLSHFQLSQFDGATQKKIFERSYAVVFLIEKGSVDGVDRALSDGICQAAIYNVALKEHLHGQHYGRVMVEALIEQVKDCNIILYTYPKTVSLYQHLGFELMKIGLAKYRPSQLDELRQMQFI